MPQMNLPYIQAPRAEKPPDQQTFEEESSQLGFEIALSRLNRVSPILSPSPPGDVAARSSDSQAALRRRLECPEGQHALGQQASALARLPGRYAPGRAPGLEYSLYEGGHVGGGRAAGQFVRHEIDGFG